jgi:glycosyltransferase involved in cell wall biosynthesis
MSVPALSVVMPVHNAGGFLDEAIASIVSQTFRDFEFVIVDDASSDGSAERAAAWAAGDARIRLVRSASRLGLSGSSNRAVIEARAPIVARMDADDISTPPRLARQFEVLQARPDVVLVGALADGIDAAGRRVRPRDRWRVLRPSGLVPFPHGSVMFRRAAFDAVGGYDERAAGVEDHDLLFRMRDVGRIVTLPDRLYRYRYHASNASIGSASAGHRAGARWAARTNRHFTRGAVRLWAGAPPRAFGPLLADRSGHGHRPRWLMLTWAAWGEISPRTLRLALRGVLTVRDRAAGLLLKEGQPYEWPGE